MTNTKQTLYRCGMIAFSIAAAVVPALAADSTAPRMWHCSYVSDPEPAVRCVPARDVAARTSTAPLWDPSAAPPDGAIDIPLFSRPREDRSDRLMGLAQSAVCGATANCYVTWHGRGR